jgi:hypothetical protein
MRRSLGRVGRGALTTQRASFLGYVSRISAFHKQYNRSDTGWLLSRRNKIYRQQHSSDFGYSEHPVDEIVMVHDLWYDRILLQLL